MSDSFFGNSAINIEPNADMRQAGVGLRQMFLGFTQAGFTETQAMQMMLTIMAKPTSPEG